MAAPRARHGRTTPPPRAHSRPAHPPRPQHRREPHRPRTVVLAVVTAALTACGGDSGPVTPDPVPAAIEVASGDGQRAVQGLRLREPIVVRVLGDAGQPLSGAAISFAPSAGHGQVDSASVATDGTGRASALWTLGPDPGEQTLTVSAGQASTRITAESIDLEAELDLLFAAPSETEIETVRADWAGRSAPAEGVRVELSEPFTLGETDATLRIVSHVVSGFRHYGAIVTPDGADDATLPLLVYLHGGDGGVSVADLQIAALGLGDITKRFAYALPSFRSEPLRHGDRTWVSEGTPSPWDYDVDDVIALVNAAFELTPEAKPGRYHLLGGSRGGGVALLTGIRDERVERIVSFFGPTDFFDDWVREIVREAALRMPRRLTGVAHLDSTIVQPYLLGAMPRSEARLELVRRSPVLFAADMPPTQVHHGTIDFVVSVSQAESLIRAMKALGRTPPDFEAYIYEAGGHDFLSLGEAIARAVAFLSRALE